MADILPFKPKAETKKEKTLLNRLAKNPHDFEALSKFLIVKIQQGKFKSDSEYAHKLLLCLSKVDVSEIDSFLRNIGQIAEAIDWHKPIDLKHFAGETKEIVEKTSEAIKKVKEQMEQGDKFRKFQSEISATLFKTDRFLDDIYTLVTIKEEKRLHPLGNTDSSDSELKTYLIDCLNEIISVHGLTESLICLLVFSYCPVLEKYTDVDIRKLLEKYPYKFSKKDKLYVVLNKITERYLTVEFNNDDINFLNLYKLFALRYSLNKEFSDVCNAILERVADTDIDAIVKIFDFDFNCDLPDNQGWVDFHSYEIAFGEVEINYRPKYRNTDSDFIRDLYYALHENEKFDKSIAFNAFHFFQYNIEECPLKLLVIASIYFMDEINIIPSEAVEGFYNAGLKYFNSGLYKESMICFKTALFNAAFMSDENPIEIINMDYFINATRKLDNYKLSIVFLSQFVIMHEHGLPLNQIFLNECEIARKELEYENESRTYNKLEGFYEIVARDDFPSIQSFLSK